MLVLIYIFAITAANLSVAAFGPWVSPINSFLLIGLDLSLRDRLHDRWHGRKLWPRMLAMIASAGAISYALNPASGLIATASVAAFCVAALVDTAVYHYMRRHRYLVKSNSSNAAGAAADSIIFPLVAFGAWMPGIIAMQFIAKVIGGALWALFLSKRAAQCPATP